MDFPNYLMSQAQLKKETHAAHGEIVFSKPFRHEAETRQHERYENSQKEQRDTLAKERGNRHFVPSVVPSILVGVEKRETVDYQSIYRRLQVSESDLLLFEEGQTQLSQHLDAFGQNARETRHLEEAPSAQTLGHVVTTTPFGKEQLFKKSKKSKRHAKKGLHRNFSGILEQEHAASKTLFESYQKERV